MKRFIFNRQCHKTCLLFPRLVAPTSASPSVSSVTSTIVTSSTMMSSIAAPSVVSSQMASSSSSISSATVSSVLSSSVRTTPQSPNGTGTTVPSPSPTASACPLYPTGPHLMDCNFDNDDTCWWERASGVESIFLLYSGSTPSVGTGPINDHTTGSGVGEYDSFFSPLSCM